MRTGNLSEEYRTIELTMIRHGQTPSNYSHRYLGWREEDLTGEAEEALKKIKMQGIWNEPELLFASPMRRCIRTAELLFPGKEMLFIPEWKEICFGRFEGKTYQELADDPAYQAWIDSNGTLPFPEGESQETFCTRVQSGYAAMCRKIAEREKPVSGDKAAFPAAAVVHGGTIMALMSALFGGDYFSYQVKNNQGYVLTLHDTGSGRLRAESYRRLA